MIGFAIPFYSGQEFLKRSIQSVIDQTYPNWKLWISDDGTANETMALVESFKDSRIVYSKNPQTLGMVGNWNRCLEIADTAYVTLLHGDDELLPNYAQAILTGFERHPNATAVFCRTSIIDERSRPLFSFPDYYKNFVRPSSQNAVTLKEESGIAAIMQGNFLFCPTVCFHKSRLGAERFSSEWKMVQDLELWTRLVFGGHRLVELSEIAYSYRRHSNNSTVSFTNDLSRFVEEIQLYQKVEIQCSKVNWTKASTVARRKSIIKLNLAYCALKDLLGFKPVQGAKKLNLLIQIVFGRVARKLK